MSQHYLMPKLLYRVAKHRFYAGIGARATPEDVGELMRQVAAKLSKEGLTLRTGGARGADSFFEKGASPNVVIYRPPTAYAASRFEHVDTCVFVHTEDKEAWESVDKYHPAPELLTDASRALLARNYRQLIGRGGEPNSGFVVCWTPDGSLTGRDGRGSGGTGQALRIAHDRAIPVYNLQRRDHRELFEEYVRR